MKQSVECDQRTLAVREFAKVQVEAPVAVLERGSQGTCLDADPYKSQGVQAVDHLPQGAVEVGSHMRLLLQDAAVPCPEVRPVRMIRARFVATSCSTSSR